MNNQLFTEDGEFDLGQLIRLLYKGRNAVVKNSIIFAIILTFISYLQTPLYTSTISIFKINENNISLLSGDIGSILGGSDNTLNERLQIDIKDIILSENLSKKIVNNNWEHTKNENLMKFWELDKPGFLSNLFSNNENKSNLKNRKVEAVALEEFSKRIKINENLKTGLVTITLSMENRELSVEILNYINNFILDFSSSNIFTLADKEIQYLNQRIDLVDLELEDSKNNLILFLEANKDYLQSPSLNRQYQDLKQILLFKESIMITLLQQIEIAQLNKVKISPVVGILDHPSIAPKKSSPKRTLYLISGLLFGFIFSISMMIYRTLNRPYDY
ncbi:MAG: hypothetical protein CMF53_00055 [Legionellales bacterium]|nr:hypothetical protein [Legionellales bacterium]|tara:strand:+ start:122 stop:1117 length:996 start_codon:yes stop_codon:yes gene_type:complete